MFFDDMICKCGPAMFEITNESEDYQTGPNSIQYTQSLCCDSCGKEYKATFRKSVIRFEED